MPEKEKTEMNIEKESEKESKISKVWNKIKKPLLTGVMAAGLLLSSSPARGITFDYVRPPPRFAAHLIKADKDINVRLGWVAINKASNLGESGRPLNERIPYYNMAITYFKRALEKNKTPENQYLYCHTLYQAAMMEPAYEATEEKELEVLKLIEERLKEQWNDMDFIDLKQIIYYNLAIMYYRAAVNFKDERGPASLDEKEAFKYSDIPKYREKAKEYIKKWLEYNEWMKENWDEFDFYLWLDAYREYAKEKNISFSEAKKKAMDEFKEGNNEREKELRRLLIKLGFEPTSAGPSF